MTVSTAGIAGIREVSRRFPDSPHGHLEDLRDDPIDLLHRVRDECGDIGRFRLADRDVVLVSGAEANEAVLPGARLDAGPGRGVPVHDADLRQGRGLRRHRRSSASRC